MPALSGKKVSAAFDGGRITSDGGVLLLAEAERKFGIADRLAALTFWNGFHGERGYGPRSPSLFHGIGHRRASSMPTGP